MKCTPCLSIVVAALALATFAPGQTCSFQLFQINRYNTLPNRIDRYGNVVGWAYPAGEYGDTYGFIRYAAGGQIVRYAVPASTATMLNDRNSSGVMVGTFQDSAGVWHGFVLYSGTLTQIDYPGAAGTSLNGINDSGIIVGDYWTASNHNYVGFELNAGTFTTIMQPGSLWTMPQGINNSDVVTGAYGTDGAWNGFVLRNGTYTTLNDPLGTSGTYLAGINNNDEIAGVYETSTTPDQGFVYRNGTFTNITVPNAMFDTADGVNDSGLITGAASFSEASYAYGYHVYIATCH